MADDPKRNDEKRGKVPSQPRKAKLDSKALPEVELVPDAWERFEKAAGKVAKAKPMPKSKPPRR